MSGYELLNIRQTKYISYTMFVLVDLVVLNLFEEFWDRVTIESFLVSLVASGLLQLLLKVTLQVEHRVAAYFKAKKSRGATVMRWLSAWFILFASKFVILGIINLMFGDRVVFDGIIPFFVVVITMLVAEAALSRIYYRLADD